MCMGELKKRFQKQARTYVTNDDLLLSTVIGHVVPQAKDQWKYDHRWKNGLIIPTFEKYFN